MSELEYFVHQTQAVVNFKAQPVDAQRLCLYYKTGGGKTIAALACVAQTDHDQAVVVCPPATYDQWIAWGTRLGVTVSPMSHARFRMKATRLSRGVPVIVDEFHLLGGHRGRGWTKMDTMARHLKAPLLILSATPNYNDAERVYCIQHVLDPHSVKGGYLEFLYRECITEQNPFSQTPDVLGFHHHKDAAAYLASLPYVEYLPDDLVYTIQDTVISANVPTAFTVYGLNRRRGRIVASQMEERHAIVNLTLIDDRGFIRLPIYDWVRSYATHASTPTLVFTAHSTVADALGRSLERMGVKHAVVTGATPEKKKQAYLDSFKDGVLDVLVGTATLATGTDGFDKVCDTLLILDDTDDDALRRQLIGRIMPRGADTDASSKQVYRLVLS